MYLGNDSVVVDVGFLYGFSNVSFKVWMIKLILVGFYQVWCGIDFVLGCGFM